MKITKLQHGETKKITEEEAIFYVGKESYEELKESGHVVVDDIELFLGEVKLGQF